jgi:arylsulfatase A-like enzyme
MKADAWEAGHRMPFIVRWPGVVKAGSVTAQTICFTDLMATFAAVTGAALPAAAGPDSFDISPVLRGAQPEDRAVRGPIVMQAGGGLTLVRDGDWKLIAGLGSGGFSQPKKVKAEPGGPNGQLYNLRDDPGETRNLWLERPEVVGRLQKTLAEIRAGAATRF